MNVDTICSMKKHVKIYSSRFDIGGDRVDAGASCG